MSEVTNEVQTEAKPKLTRAEKLIARSEVLRKRIEADTAEYNEVANELNNLAALANVAIGTKVVIKLGRAETARVLDAVVVGVKDEEDGSKKYKVQYGTGFDADLATITAGQIQSIAAE